MSSPTLAVADIDWTEAGTPVSKQFGDVYFSREDGLEEARHVFLRGNRLPDAWHGRDLFCIGELGFGCGLNFLATWQAWLTRGVDRGRLHFVSVEGFPLARKDLVRALRPWPELDVLAQSLIAAYPPPARGFHRRHFPGGVTLTLLFDEVESALAALNGEIDAWYLDGFAPACNDAMWSSSVFAELRRLSRSAATFSTFSAATAIRRRLHDAGFAVEKAAGFGRKREMARGRLTAYPDRRSVHPWFHVPHRAETAKRALVIGAGIAGTATADALNRRGWQVTLVDRARIAGGASAAPAALVAPRLSLQRSPRSAFYLSAFQYADEFVRAMATRTSTAMPCGALTLALTDIEVERQRRLAAEQALPSALLNHVDADTASALAQVPLACEALHFPTASLVEPHLLCESLAAGSELLLGRAVHAIEHRDGLWWARDLRGEGIAAAPIVVLANGIDVTRFAAASHLPLQAIRGQMSFMPQTAASARLRTALVFGPYVTPALAGRHIVGATFDRLGATAAAMSQQPEAMDHRRNEAAVERVLPGLLGAAVAGWAGVRCTTPDGHAVIGPMPDAAFYRRAYGGLEKGRRDDYPDGQYLPGLYGHLALGSHGISAALLGAELLASQMSAEPWPVERDVGEGLHAARFLIRAIKRRQPAVPD